MIALTIAGVTSATVAYFSKATYVEGNTFAMGTVDVISIGGLPYMFTNMIPGEQRVSDIIKVQNTGSIPIDLYVGQRDTSGGGGINFIGNVGYAIVEVQWNEGIWENVKTWVGWQDIESLFSTWKKVGQNIPANAKRYYRVYVKPSETMGDGFQGGQAITDVILYAVQAGAPAPTTPIPANWP